MTQEIKDKITSYIYKWPVEVQEAMRRDIEFGYSLNVGYAEKGLREKYIAFAKYISGYKMKDIIHIVQEDFPKESDDKPIYPLSPQCLDDILTDFIHDHLKKCGYSTGSEEDYDKLSDEQRRRITAATNIIMNGVEQSADYWKELAMAANEVIKVMNVPKNQPILVNDQFLLFVERYSNWQALKNKIHPFAPY